MRLQVLMARHGAASRRAAERLIAAGRVTVNGRVIDTPGSRVDPDLDTVAIDGAVLPPALARRVIMLHKPRGFICSRNTDQGRTVFELLGDMPTRLICVGRLDKDTEGLLLLSTDGEIANRLMHPRFGHRKIYRAIIDGPVSADALHRLRQPIRIDGRRTCPATVCRESSCPSNPGQTILRVELQEGRNRQIRRLCETADIKLVRLIRIAYGSLQLGRLPIGRWRELTADEYAAMC